MTKFQKAKKQAQKDRGKAAVTGKPVIRSFQVKSFMEAANKSVQIPGGLGKTQMADMIFSIDSAKGLKPGDLAIFAGGRSSGKSSYVSMMIHKARENIMRQPIRWSTEPHGQQWASYSLPFGLYASRPLRLTEIEEMKEFCENTFGRGGKIGSTRWACSSLNDGCFWFGTERDQIVFKMAFEGHL